MHIGDRLLLASPLKRSIACSITVLGLIGALSGCGDAPTASPQTLAGVQALLVSAEYKAWHCESAPHAARSPSPHGINRICSNDLLSGNPSGDYPVGAASVKEIYADDGHTISGYAYARKVGASQNGDGWYWYAGTATTAEVEGLGSTSASKTACVGCHRGAGSDANHSGHDFVYTQVR